MRVYVCVVLLMKAGVDKDVGLHQCSFFLPAGVLTMSTVDQRPTAVALVGRGWHYHLTLGMGPGRLSWVLEPVFV